MLTNIHKSNLTLCALTNDGQQDSHLVGEFGNLGADVWYNPNSIANILSLADVRKICRVILDTSAEPALCVHCPDGSVIKFVEHNSGPYVYDSTTTHKASNAKCS